MANRKIVRVKRSSKYSDRIIIYLDDKSVFRIPEDAFVSNPLHAGETVSLEKIASFGKKMRLQEARDAAFRLLGYRMRSIEKKKKRLKDKDFDEEEIGKTIHYLPFNNKNQVFIVKAVSNGLSFISKIFVY